MRKFIFILFLGVLFSHCTESNTPVKTYTIGFSQCCHDPWRDVMNKEMLRELAFHRDIKLDIRDPYNNNETQIQQIRELVKKKVDLLIVSPNESQPLTAVIDEVYKAGIPVILIDRKTDSDQYSAYVGADNYEIGKTAGKYIANQFKNGGNIIEVKLQMTISPAIERDRGFHDAIAAAPQLKIVSAVEAKTGLEDISEQLPNILAKHPEANIIFGHTDLLADFAYKIAQKQGREKSIFFVGIDGLPITQGVQAVQNGSLNASLLYPTGGAEAIQTAVKILKKQAFEKENRLITTVITPENVSIFLAQFQKLDEQQSDIERQALKVNELNKTYSSQRNRLYFTTTLLIIVVGFGAVLFYLLREKQLSNKILAEQNQAILEQKNEIEKVSNIAKQATEEKMRFYSYISHEFRTPLSLILTPTEDLLQQKTLDAKETRNTLQFIRKNANRVLRLVDQLLELRKIDAGKMVLEAHTSDIVAFVKDIVYDFKVKAKNNHIDLQFICPFETLPFSFDAEKLDKVLFNIISNSFKYTPNGGLIHVSLLKNVDKIDIIIADNGVGMSETDKEHAFDLFYRGNQNMSFGMGLGLALSKEFVDLHHGKILLASEKGKGTTFRVSLPYTQTDTVLSDTQTMLQTHFTHTIDNDIEQPKEKNTPPQYSDTTIVLIEDNPDLNLFLKQKLENCYHIAPTDNAEQGWDLILEHIPDIIISDVMLPNMDGYTLTQKVKNDFRTSHIPVILLTAKGQVENQIEGIKAGADAYMTKPFNQQLLEERIKNMIDNRDKMRRRFSNEITNPSHVPKNERKFLVEFETLIEKHIKDSTLSVEKLSQELGMSRVQLFRKISALTNKNVTDYIAEFKLQKAKALLKDTDKTVAEIAYETGFNNPSYFTTFFKQKTNQTPSEWRQQ
ncbi:MAG: substrate-binding domain-containing protein [Saprospiraceae bacterium]|nr:substrate-binding domain-containing protein [Saprospiraceae bacterium]